MTVLKHGHPDLYPMVIPIYFSLDMRFSTKKKIYTVLEWFLKWPLMIEN